MSETPGFEGCTPRLTGQPGNLWQGRRLIGKCVPVRHDGAVTDLDDAARSGDMAGLEKLFAADVQSVSDGNGAIRVARTPVLGPVRVAKFFTAISGWYWEGVEISWAEANGRTAAVMHKDGAFIGVITVTASDDLIDRVLWMVVPEKLAQLA